MQTLAWTSGNQPVTVALLTTRWATYRCVFDPPLLPRVVHMM